MIRFIFFTLIISVSMLSAQAIKPNNSNIKLEVLNEDINPDEKNQIIRLQLTCETPEEVKSYFIRFEKTPARWAVVSAELNGESLWLLKTNARVTNGKALAWDFENNTDQLRLFPFNWQTPYVLDLQLQSDIHNHSKENDYSEEKVVLEADLESDIYTASPTGRGNIITVR
jgi:hypothetical protein